MIEKDELGNPMDTERGTLIGTDRLYTIQPFRPANINAAGTAFFQARLNSSTGPYALIKGSAIDNLSIVAKTGDVSPLGGDLLYNVHTNTAPRTLADDYMGFVSKVSGTGVITDNLPTRNELVVFASNAAGVLKALAREGDEPARPILAIDFEKTSTTKMEP